MVRAIWIAVVVALSLASGCMSFNEVQCSDGHLCPPGSRCDDINGGCILSAQLQACDGIVDGANCQIDGADGTCVGGACIAWRCGDNRLNPGEACDHTPSGPDFGGMDCTDFGFRNADGLQCTEDCRINKDNCTGGCGDGVRDQTELCDGTDFKPGTTCQSLGYYDAPGLLCSAFCTYEIKNCTGYCGDFQKNGPEQCDGGPAAGESCLDYSFDAGRLGCTLCAPGFEGCSNFGWTRATTPSTQRIRGIWGSSSTDVYAVGAAGTLLRYDGAQVAAITPAVTNQDLNAIWGFAANNIYAVGAGGTILHYDGAWSSTTSGTATLAGIWGSAPNDIYAVGLAGTILHYTNTWSAVTGTGVGAIDMRAVWGTGSDVFVVGASGTVAHLAGSTWTTTTIAGTPELFSVWGTSPTNVYASGNDGSGAGIVLHYTGSTWTPVYNGPTNARYGAVWGGAANDAFAVGNTLLHHDGTAWTPLSLPPEVQAGTKLWAGWVSPTGDIWTGGDGGYLAHWGGASWTTPTAATTVWFRGVTAWTPSDAFAVGFTTLAPSPGGAIARYNGATWTVTPTASTADQLYGVWAADQSFAAAVGENSSAGILYQFNGSSWANIPQADAKNCGALPTTGFRGVWGSGTSNVLAVGGSASGMFRQSNGSCWSAPAAQPAAPGTFLFGLFGINSTNVFATAINSIVHKFDGSNWTTLPAMPSPAPAGLVTTWGSSASDLFAVGDAIMHFDGSKWSRMTANGQVLGAVSGTGPRNVFASGGNGRLLHYDGVSWTPIRVPVPAAPPVTFLRGLAATARSLIVVGDYGFVQRLSFSLRPKEINCRDGWDDDGDGMPDCADSDCQTDDYCTRGGACTTIKDVECGKTITGTTLGRTPGRDYYTCDTNPETGPEAIYRVVPPAGGTATATLSAFGSAELDLVVVGSMAATDGCDPDAACLGASSQTSTATEMVTFPTTANRAAYIVVEGRNAASGPFSLQVTCQ